jgi:ribonuclease HI
MAIKKFYVVWEGTVTGILTDWVQCQQAIKGFSNPKYKAYKSITEAQKAFAEGYEKHWGKGDAAKKFYTAEEIELIGKPVVPSIYLFSSVDRETRIMTYEGVDTASAEVLFRQGPFEDCDQHAGGFLSIVHALAFLKQQGSTIPVYTRVQTARKWVIAEKQFGGQLEPTENNKKAFELIVRANKWLATNDFENQVLLWNKRAWGYPGDLLVELHTQENPQPKQKQ